MEKQCIVCGKIDGKQFRHHYTGLVKNVKIKNYHVIPSIWKSIDFLEFKGLTVPLCQRCHDCCPP